MEDIKGKIEEIVKKATEDKSFGNNFMENPVKTVEEFLGVDLPDETINKIVEGVKAKLAADGAKSIFKSIMNIFKKK